MEKVSDQQMNTSIQDPEVEFSRLFRGHFISLLWGFLLLPPLLLMVYHQFQVLVKATRHHFGASEVGKQGGSRENQLLYTS